MPISPRDTTVVMKYISKRIASKELQFEPLTPHTLRHTFDTRWIEKGMNPKTWQIILGHSTIQITLNLYCHVTDDMLVSEMSKFESGSEHKTWTSHANACLACRLVSKWCNPSISYQKILICASSEEQGNTCISL